MTRSGVRGVRGLQQQDRQHQGMIKCMNEYAAPLKKNEYTKLMSQLRSSSTTISTPTPTPQPPFSTTTYFTSKPPRTTNPSKFAGIGGPPPNRLVFHALPSSPSSKPPPPSSSSSKEEKAVAVALGKKKLMMKKKIGSDAVTTTLNHRFVTWRVEDHNRGKGLNYSGVSATELAGRLSGDFWDDQIDDDEDDDEEYEEEEDLDLDQDLGLGLEDTEVFPSLPTTVQSVKVSRVEVIDSKIKEDEVDSSDERIEIEDDDDDESEEEEEEDDDDHMSFCEVEFMVEQLDDEEEVGWCLVDDY